MLEYARRGAVESIACCECVVIGALGTRFAVRAERISLYVLPTGQGSRCRTQHAIHAPYGSPYAVPTHIFSRAAVPLGGAARDGIVGLTIIGASVEIRVLPP